MLWSLPHCRQTLYLDFVYKTECSARGHQFEAWKELFADRIWKWKKKKKKVERTQIFADSSESMVWDVTSGYSHMQYGNLSAAVMWGLTSKTLCFQLQGILCRQICPERRHTYVKWNAVCFLCFLCIYIIFRVLNHSVVSSGAGFFWLVGVFFSLEKLGKSD